MAYLAINLNNDSEFAFDLLEPRLTLGRDGRNDIEIENGYISGRHAELIRQEDGNYEVVDLNSSNGTFVNGKRIERAKLKHGDRVRFGQLESRYRERAPKSFGPADATAKPKAGGRSPAPADGRMGDTDAVTLPGKPESGTARVGVAAADLQKKTVSDEMAAENEILRAQIEQAKRTQTELLKAHELDRSGLEQQVTRLQLELEKASKTAATAVAEHKALAENDLARLKTDLELAQKNQEDGAKLRLAEKAALEQQIQKLRIALEKSKSAPAATSVELKPQADPEVTRLAAELAEAQKARAYLELSLQREKSSFGQQLVALSDELAAATQSKSLLESEATAKITALEVSLAAARDANTQEREDPNKVSKALAAPLRDIEAVEARLKSTQERAAAEEARLIKIVGETTTRELAIKQIQADDAAAAERAARLRQDEAKAKKQFAKLQEDLEKRAAHLKELDAKEKAGQATLLRLTQDVQAAELALAKAHKAKLDNSTALATETGDELEQLLNHVAEAEAKLNQLSIESAAKWEELKSQVAAEKTAKQKLTDLGAQLEKRTAELGQLAGDDVTDSALAIHDLGKQRQAMELALSSLSAKAQRQENEASAIARKVSDAQASLDTIDRQRSVIESEAQKLAQERALHKSGIASAKAELTQLESKKADLEAAIKKADADLAALQKLSVDLPSLKAEFETTEARRKAAKTDASALERSIAVLQKKQQDFEEASIAKRDLLEDEQAAAAAKLRETQSHLAEMRSKENLLAAKLDELSATDERLGDASQSLKLVESQRAAAETQRDNLAAEVRDLIARKNEEIREHSQAAERGTAQRLLVARIMEQRLEAEAEGGKANQVLAQLNGSIDAKSAQLAEVEGILKTRIIDVEEAEANLNKLRGEIIAVGNEKSGLDESLALLHGESEQKQAELQRLEKAMQRVRSELASAESRLEDRTTKHQSLTEQSGLLENLIAGLHFKEGDLKQRLQSLTGEVSLTENLLREHKVEHAEISSQLQKLQAQKTELERKTSSLASVTKQLAQAKNNLEETESSVAAERDSLQQLEEEKKRKLEKLQPLRDELMELDQKVAALMADRQHVLAAVESATAAKAEADAHAQRLHTEASDLHKLITEKRAAHENDVTTKQKQRSELEQQLQTLGASINKAESQLVELRDVEKRLEVTHLALQEAELKNQSNAKQEQQITAEIETLKSNLRTLQEQAKAFRETVDDLGRKAKTEEARLADVEKRLARATVSLESTEAKRADAEARLVQLQTEEKKLKMDLPSLVTEVAALTTALAGLVMQRESVTSSLNRLSSDQEQSSRVVQELQTRTANLDEGIRAREQRLAKAEADLEATMSRLTAAQEQAKMTEEGAHETAERLEKAQVALKRAQADAAKLESESGIARERMQTLSAEEHRLLKDVEALQRESQAQQRKLAATQQTLAASEAQLHEVTTTGGKVLSLNDAVRVLEGRQREATTQLKKATEQELALQTRINTLQETVSRETQWTEQVLKERTHTEEQAKAQLAELENRIREYQSLEQQAATAAQGMHKDLQSFEAKTQELRELEHQVGQWTEVEKRLRGQLEELEEKHDILRRGLAADDATVMMFANDLIKRIDLIDILIQRYSGQSAAGVEQQLRTLRASFEDILLQYGISEFDVAPGTEVDVGLRHRIAVIEAIPGNGKPEVVTTFRPGFVLSPPSGREVVLRKVEVKTSSQ